jgi:hypothetical protein
MVAEGGAGILPRRNQFRGIMVLKPKSSPDLDHQAKLGVFGYSTIRPIPLAQDQHRLHLGSSRLSRNRPEAPI